MLLLLLLLLLLLTLLLLLLALLLTLPTSLIISVLIATWPAVVLPAGPQSCLGCNVDVHCCRTAHHHQ
jgi:hypothetical protein